MLLYLYYFVDLSIFLSNKYEICEKASFNELYCHNLLSLHTRPKINTQHVIINHTLNKETKCSNQCTAMLCANWLCSHASANIALLPWCWSCTHLFESFPILFGKALYLWKNNCKQLSPILRPGFRKHS